MRDTEQGSSTHTGAAVPSNLTAKERAALLQKADAELRHLDRDAAADAFFGNGHAAEHARGRIRLMRAYDARAVSVAGGVNCGCDCKVQQQFKDEVDVNTIVRRFGVTGVAPVMREGGMYGDFTGISDYESALARVEQAQEMFMQLAPEVRDRFGNKPGEFLAFAESAPDEVLAELGAPPRAAAGPGVPGPEVSPAAAAAAVAPVVPVTPPEASK